MKTSKKVLGVVLTLIMLVNVFAVSVFAAYPDDAACALIVKTDKDTYAAGDDVTLTVAIKATADVGPMCLAGQYELGFNSAAIQPVDTSDDLAKHSFTPDAFYASAYDSSMSQAIFNDDIGSSITAGNGWDSLMLVCVADDGATAKDCADTEATLFTIKMKIPADAADGTYTIGFNRDGYETNFTAYATDINGGGLYGNDGSGFGKTNMFDFGVATFNVGAGGSTEPEQPTVKVNNLETQVQWANKDAGLMNLGFRGQIAEGYDATADKDGTKGPNGGDNLTKLTEVGFYLNGTKYSAYTIYDFVNGGYFYRVVVGNVSYDSETVFSAQAYVMIDGQEYKADASFETTGKAQYERAKDSMGAK